MNGEKRKIIRTKQTKKIFWKKRKIEKLKKASLQKKIDKKMEQNTDKCVAS